MLTYTLFGKPQNYPTCSTWVHFNSNHIMFRNVEISKWIVFRGKKFLKENKESDAIVKNVSFVEMASSELIN
jgi:hypothetical protein